MYYNGYKVNADRCVSLAAAAGKLGTVQGEESELVGEVYGQGFGIGVAPPGVKPNVSTLVSTRKVNSRGKGKEGTVQSPPLARGSAGQTDG